MNLICGGQEIRSGHSSGMWRTVSYTEADFGENSGKLVAGLPDPGVSVKPGDVKYRDLNGDEEITSDDQTIIGNPTRPAYTFGLNFI